MIGRLIVMLLFRPAARRWVLMIGGVLLALAGLLYGVSSHTVTYGHTEKEKIDHYLRIEGSSKTSSDDDIAYIQLQDGSLYYLHQDNFSPTISAEAVQQVGEEVSVIFEPTDTKSIDEEATNTGTKLEGSAANLVQLTAYNENGQPSVFTTDEFKQNPTGFYRNNWVGGSVIIILGLILAVVGFILPKTGFRNRKAQPVYPGQPYNGQPPMGQPVYPAQPQNAYPAQPSYYGQQPYSGQPPMGQPQNPYPGQQPPAYPAQPYQGQPQNPYPIRPADPYQQSYQAPPQGYQGPGDYPDRLPDK